MRVSITSVFATLTLALGMTSLVSAGVVITPVTPDQVVEKTGGDCYFGVVTPRGCAPLRS
ncbi:hypothetical protein ACRALDRAFT_1061623 [Sodiomyces alcalophilus JCM 7366]|uniref:uncharacterized protein n=1 Tax=Sodiomyces alcalophilus JCM 7366 TaxID=591952 RepID=UPI0039B36C52